MVDDDEENIDTLVYIMTASHGGKVLALLTERIEMCRLAGDVEGLSVWRKVEAKIVAKSARTYSLSSSGSAQWTLIGRSVTNG